jgi:uncharacterized membrane protein
MYDLIGIVVFMSIVVGLAAGVLFLVDRLTLRSDLTEEERKAIVSKRSGRLSRAWGTFYLSMAVIALVVNGLNLTHESLRSRIGWSALAAVVVISYLLYKGKTGGGDQE